MNEKGFAYLPDDGRPPRLIRYCMLTGGLIALYNHQKNLLRVDRRYYDALDVLDQGRVLATDRDLYATDRGGRISIAHS